MHVLSFVAVCTYFLLFQYILGGTSNAKEEENYLADVCLLYKDEWPGLHQIDLQRLDSLFQSDFHTWKHLWECRCDLHRADDSFIIRTDREKKKKRIKWMLQAFNYIMFSLSFCSYINCLYNNFVQVTMKLKQGVFLEKVFTTVHTAIHCSPYLL